jgi:hypothetical protein
MAIERNYDSEQIQDLVEMVKAMTKLQASLEVQFLTVLDIELSETTAKMDSELLIDVY